MGRKVVFQSLLFPANLPPGSDFGEAFNLGGANLASHRDYVRSQPSTMPSISPTGTAPPPLKASGPGRWRLIVTRLKAPWPWHGYQEPLAATKVSTWHTLFTSES